MTMVFGACGAELAVHGAGCCPRFLWRPFEFSMGRFKKVTSAAAGGAAAAPGSAPPTVTDLAVLTTVSPLQLGGVTTVGRVTFVFGSTDGALHWCGGWFCCG